MKINFESVRLGPQIVVSCRVEDGQNSLIGSIVYRRDHPSQFVPNECVPIELDEMEQILAKMKA